MVPKKEKNEEFFMLCRALRRAVGFFLELGRPLQRSQKKQYFALFFSHFWYKKLCSAEMIRINPKPRSDRDSFEPGSVILIIRLKKRKKHDMVFMANGKSPAFLVSSWPVCPPPSSPLSTSTV